MYISVKETVEKWNYTDKKPLKDHMEAVGQSGSYGEIVCEIFE